MISATISAYRPWSRYGHIPSSIIAFAAVLLALMASPPGWSDFADDIDIPFERYVLDNGLTLIVHEDRKAPIVSVNVWYHVGSKNERPGITGFAHLFEHLMFNGSENYDGEWFLPLEKAGATDLNGTTWFDRTNYFQTVPTPALDMVLWLESDRMGHFLGAVTQERLDEQRSVVQNEKRQGDNRPYGRAGYTQLRGMFPEGHPYRWSTIGSLEDLNNASLDDVKEWFKTYYGAANAVLVLAGDISGEEALEKVKHYFGDIAPGPALTKPEKWVAKRTESTRDRMEDEVSQARLTKSWNSPPFGEHDAIFLDIAAKVLAGGKNSRLYKRLVYDDQLASSVGAAQVSLEIAGIFEIEAYAKPGVELAALEQAMNEEIEQFLSNGPTRSELERIKTSYFANLIRGLEKVGGFGGKSQLLATYQTYLDDAGLFKEHLKVFEEATPRQIRDAAQQWLASGDHNLEVYPRGKYQVAEEGADRSSLPLPGPAPESNFPAVEEYSLKNGIRVLQVQRGSLPVTSISMTFDAGYAADSNDQLGVSALMSTMLDEGTKNYSALEFSEQAEELGALYSAQATLDTTQVSMSALNQNLEDSLELYSEMIREPAFDEQELERVRSNWLDRIAREKTDPFSLALRTLPPLLFGDNHPYGIPFTGSGTEESIQQIDAEALASFHRTWIRPDNAAMIIVGNLNRDEVEPLLDKAFGDWSAPKSQRPVKQLTEVAAQEKSIIYLLDKPGSPQSLVIGGQLLPPTGDDGNIETDMAVRILGGNFNARLNMNLREDKGWAYGARANVTNAVGQRPLIYYAPVQIDKTVDSLRELIREAEEYLLARPATLEELERSRDGVLRSRPGAYETNSAVRAQLESILRFKRPLDYVNIYEQKVKALTPEVLHTAAKDVLTPDQTVWLIVGDLKQIEGPLRESGIADVVVLDK